MSKKEFNLGFNYSSISGDIIPNGDEIKAEIIMTQREYTLFCMLIRITRERIRLQFDDETFRGKMVVHLTENESKVIQKVLCDEEIDDEEF